MFFPYAGNRGQCQSIPLGCADATAVNVSPDTPLAQTVGMLAPRGKEPLSPPLATYIDEP